MDGKTVTQPPAAASYTEVTTGATGTSSEKNTAGTLNLLVGASSTDAISNAYTKALANSSTFTLTVGFKMNLTGTTYPGFFIGLSDGTGATGNEQAIVIGSSLTSGTVIGSGVQNMVNWAYNAWVNIGSSANPIPLSLNGIGYFRIRHASGTRYYEVSADRNNWSVVYSTTTSSHTTPTHYFLRAAGRGSVAVFHLLDE